MLMGSIRYVRDRAFPIHDENGAVYRIAGITQDMTLLKQRETDRIALAVSEERVNVLKDFISDASHDLRNPLAIMSLKIDLLERTKEPENQQKHLDDLRKQIDRASQFIDNIFTLSRLESETDQHFVPTDANTLLQDIYTAMRPMAEKRKHQLILDLSAIALPKIMVERDSFVRAINNLVQNAIKYTPEGGLILIQTRAKTERAEVAITVSDNGIGIPEDEVSDVFKRFFRASTAKDKRINGTGLGLAIVKTVIDNHQGTIEVTSTPNQGTTFTVRMPAI